jgi:LacI family transcriptional regulator
MKDIADAAGVSIATVSRVLNNKPDVNPATRDKVLAHVKGTDYRPRQSKTGLRLIGFVNKFQHYDIHGEYVAALISGAHHRVSNHAYSLVLIDSDSVQKEIRWPGRYEILDEVSGVIWSMPVFEDIHRQFLEERGIPHVVINNLGQGVSAPFVESDNVMAAKQAVEYLASMGHTRIGFIGGQMDIANIRDRYDGYLKHMEGFGLEMDKDWIVDDLANIDTNSGIEGTHRLLGRKSLPTALISANESVTVGVYDVLKSRGIRVPDDISIVSFDDTHLSPMLNPPVTTFRQHLGDMAGRAVDFLIDSIHHPEATADAPHIAVPLTLIVRDSVKAITR